jgi:hypothetical protein
MYPSACGWTGLTFVPAALDIGSAARSQAEVTHDGVRSCYVSDALAIVRCDDIAHRRQAGVPPTATPGPVVQGLA